MTRSQWLALSTAPETGRATMGALLARFGSLEQALAASDESLAQTSRRMTPAVIAHVRAHADDPDPAEGLARRRVQLVTPEDAAYPARLRDPGIDPAVLYVRGSLLPADGLAVAVVGSRAPSPEGLTAARTVAGELARRGVTVVSGLAIGIDSAAHRAALEAGGRTLAVLPSGCWAVHPRSNRQLAERIARQGALLSEYPPDDRIVPERLLVRNALIASLCLAMVVADCALPTAGQRDPGTLHAARRALGCGRRLFVAPPAARAAQRLAGREGNSTLHPLDPDAVDWDAWVARLQELPRGLERRRQGSLW